MLFVLSFTDFLLVKDERMHKYLYHLAFGLTFFLFTIKYYYGADMVLYVTSFDAVETPLELLKGSRKGFMFEAGFMYFMSTLKWLGVSYWGMTALISVVYFYALYKLFKYIPKYRILALFVLVVLDYNLIFATHRQCLAVSFFILLFLAYINRKYIKVLIYAVLMLSIHKSGFVFLFPSLIFWSLHIYIKRESYWICLAIMLVFALLPLRQLYDWAVHALPISGSLKSSLIYHGVFFARFQSILILYTLVFVILALYTTKEPVYKKMSVIVFLGAITIALFYQSFATLWRLRSYFLPFLVVYIFYVIYESQQRDALNVSQFVRPVRNILVTLSVGFILAYCAYLSYQSHRMMNALTSGIYDTCTVFDLLHKSSREIKRERMYRATKYWHFDNRADYATYKNNK